MNTQHNDRLIARWIFLGVAMLIIQVLLGGITRLTGSGLSITEWEVVTGTIPPLNNDDWITEFAKYKTTPQYLLLNFDFTLQDFKFIFFWEWLHRFWGRLIGIAFAIPFVIFLIQKRFRKEMIGPLIILFLLGALQGVIGWIMVQSGLSGDAIYVAPTRLALHFFMAMVLVGYAFWFGLKLSVRTDQRVNHAGLGSLLIAILVILGIQFVFGALMAGHKAAPYAPTWPDINGTYFPSQMFSNRAYSLIDSPITIHFIHRNLAYLISVIVLIWSLRAAKLKGDLFNRIKWIPLILVLLQVTLGVFSLTTSVQISAAKWGTFEWMAQLHQLVAMLFMLSLLANLFVLNQSTHHNTFKRTE